MNPTEEQLNFFEAVDKSQKSVVLSATAGSGKSSSIKEAIKRKRGIARQSVLFNAFNKSTAKEQEGQFPDNVKVSTSHSFGFSQLLASGLYKPQSVDKNKLYIIAEKVLKKKKYADYLTPKNLNKVKVRIVKSVSMAKNMMAMRVEDVQDAIERTGVKTVDFPPFLDACIEILAKSNKSKLIDFDDMLYLPALLGTRGEIKVKKYDIVIADEAQDFSTSQQTLTDLATGGRLIAAGDVRQSISAFRGADERNFQKLLSRSTTEVFPLSITWRCARSIVALAQKYNPQIVARPDAPEGIIDEPKSIREANTGDMIISYRNLPAITACVKLIRAGRGATFIGEDFSKDLKSYIQKTKTSSCENAAIMIQGRLDETYNQAFRKYGDSVAKMRWLQMISEKASLAIYFCKQTSNTTDAINLIDRVFNGKSGDIVCSTIHKAKGAEANRVFILEFDKLTEASEVDEQMRNLTYVGITRAKNHLSLMYSN